MSLGVNYFLTLVFGDFFNRAPFIAALFHCVGESSLNANMSSFPGSLQKITCLFFR